MVENSQRNIQEQIQQYQNVVQEYERLDREIDTLIMRNGGASRNMSAGDRERYRELAKRRSDLFNQMRVLEQDLLDEE